jgi:CheY-like chemotaxis protein
MSIRILIIEENKNDLELMTYLLSHSGYTVIVAKDGEEGILKALSERLNLIICDIFLRKTDSFAFAKQLKSHEALCKIPLLVITAYAMAGDRNKFLTAGFDGYISKPIAPEIFVSQIEHFLNL